jgi:glycosyltransferase involved in cell wall biosynthesis
LKITIGLDHKKLLKIYEKSSISVVNPTWEEPFGRTALESASRGCAVITSKSGGLSETFNNNLILKNNNPQELIKLLSLLIKIKNYFLKYKKKILRM